MHMVWTERASAAGLVDICSGTFQSGAFQRENLKIG